MCEQAGEGLDGSTSAMPQATYNGAPPGGTAASQEENTSTATAAVVAGTPAATSVATPTVPTAAMVAVADSGAATAITISPIRIGEKPQRQVQLVEQCRHLLGQAGSGEGVGPGEGENDRDADDAEPRGGALQQRPPGTAAAAGAVSCPAAHR